MVNKVRLRHEEFRVTLQAFSVEAPSALHTGIQNKPLVLHQQVLQTLGAALYLRSDAINESRREFEAATPSIYLNI